MSTKEFAGGVRGQTELEITVKGRQTGKAHSTIVWFVHEGDKVHLLPVKGSDTNWYRNVVKDPSIRLSVRGRSLQARAKPLTSPEQVKRIIQMFAKKYGGMDEINKWYSKLDVAVEVPLV